MQRPIDQPERSHLVHKAVLNGDYELKMSCSNMAKTKTKFGNPSFKIRAGEKLPYWGVTVQVNQHCSSFYLVCKFQLKAQYI